MSGLVQQRCQLHHDREAVARCPECAKFYCRECVTEHEERMICASCLRRMTEAGPAHERVALRVVGRVLLAGGGVFLAWCWFFVLGQILLKLPSQFHEGTGVLDAFLW